MEMDFLRMTIKISRNCLLETNALKINAIMLGSITLLLIFTFPETLFSRDDYSNEEGLSYWQKITFHGKVLNRPLKFADFGNNFVMMKYWAVIIPCVYYATYVFASYILYSAIIC